jgi:hypothetical protein
MRPTATSASLSRHVTEAIVLTNATDTRWFHSLLSVADAVLLYPWAHRVP